MTSFQVVLAGSNPTTRFARYSNGRCIQTNTMIKSILIAGTIAGALSAPAFAGGLEGSYAGVGAAIGTDDADTTVAITGRVDTRDFGAGVPISVRPTVTIGDVTGGSLGVSYDLGVAKGVNIYAGGGAGFGAGTALNTSDEVVGYVNIGAEGAVAENVVLFADFKVGFGGETSYVPTVGVSYKF